MKRVFRLLVIFVASLLTACGGGTDTWDSVGPPNAAPVARAGADQSATVGLRAALDGTASSDADGDNLTYAWTLVERPAGSAATLAGPATARPTFTPDVEGRYTLRLTVNDGLDDSAVATVTVTATAPVAPQIVMSLEEPVSTTVRLSLSGTVSGPVTWYVDLQLLRAGGTAAGAPANWNTTSVTNGPHLVVARIQTSATTFEEVRRTVTVLNSTLSLGPTVSGTPAFTNVDVRAISDVAITEVSATLDRVPAGSLNAPNACSATCKGVNDIYRFTFETASMGVGEHTVVITAVDVARSRRQVSVTVPFTNTPSPVLTLASPLDGTLVYDTLQIAGTAFSDRAGTVTVTARLGDVEFYRGTTANFSASYKVAGLLPGPYTLLIRATDAARRSSSLSRTVLVTSASERAYAPLFTMPLAGQLRAVEGTQILYDTGEGRVVLRDAITGTEVTLDGAAGIEYSSDWQLSGGRVYVSGKGADCVQYCIYQWTADGTRVNLTNPNPYSQGATTSAGGIFDLHPVARSGYVAWVNDMVLDRPGPGRATGRYTIHNVATGTYTRVGVPADANYVGNWRYDLAVVNGVVHFYFWGQTGGSSARSMYDIYKWQSDTGATTRLTPGGAVAIYVQTDGVRVAWQQSPSTLDETHSLMVQPVEGGAAAVAGSHESTYLLEDGVLAWAEKTPAGLAVRASTATSAVTRLGGDAAHLVANAGGHVIYVEQGKIYSWNAATGVHTLRLEGPGGPFMVGGGALVFVINQTVYRVAL